MTDQEFNKELADLMTDETQGDKKGKKKKGARKKMSRKHKMIIGVAVLSVALVVVLKASHGSNQAGIQLATAQLSKGDIEEVLSISGPVDGTDSADVVSRLHAEILEITVKEGDIVEAGQVLARLDPTDVQKEVDIARNTYELAAANLNEAQTKAELGYAKAQQDLSSAQLDYDRKSVLFEAGDISRAEMEAAENILSDAKRQMESYTVEDGQVIADRSYELQVRNAEFELEQKSERLKETEVTSPISGTVVRVNSRVGRFADTIDDYKPLFEIYNLEKLEMKINVSEYSIGKVKLGQTVEISADILEGETVEGVITAISPTGEEKGGGSTERVIPTTIQINSSDTKLIAGITARAKIVLNEAKDVWVVPISSLLVREQGTYLATVENGVVNMIAVETGVEGDVSIEIKGEGLSENVQYIISPDPSLVDGIPVNVSPSGVASSSNAVLP